VLDYLDIVAECEQVCLGDSFKPGVEQPLPSLVASVTQRQAAEHLDTGSGPPDPGTLRVYVAQLRKKLGDDAADPRLILTYFGLGYRWIGGDGSD